MANLRLLLRWSVRDLRDRRFQVLAISIIIGIGTGAYVGLGSNTTWREYAFTESNSSLKMFDLKMSLPSGSWINKSLLNSIIEDLPHSNWINALEYRITFPTSINATNNNQSVLTSGKIIGIDVRNGSDQLSVNGIKITDGRSITNTEQDASVCILEHNFAKYHNLEPNEQNITLPGGVELSFIGVGLSPEYFMVIDEIFIMAESYFGVVFLPLHTAETIIHNWIGLPQGNVNEALFILTDDSDLDIFENELKNAIEVFLPSMNPLFLEKMEEPAYKLQKEDIKSDQDVYYVLSFLVLLIAAFGSYNLISRVVHSQRRQIGINMALGVSPWQIASRYLIFSFEIAIGGIFMGLILAVLLGNRFGEVISHVVPFPIWKQWLVVDLFIQGSIIGILIPFLASLVPIFRAIRVRPIHAIYTGSIIFTGKGAAPLLERLPFPGSIFIQLPFRNLARNLQRTFSTLLGVALAISVLVAVFGLLDGGNYLLLNEQQIMEGSSPTRIEIRLNNFYNESSSIVNNLIEIDSIDKSSFSIQIQGKMFSDHESFSMGLTFIESDNSIWIPNLVSEDTSSTSLPEIILPQKAASDLRVTSGDIVTVEHIFRESDYHYTQKNTSFKIKGIYKSQVRFWAFVDISNRNLINCTELINSISLLPKPGFTFSDIKSDLFGLPGYTSAQSIPTIVEVYDRLLQLFSSVLEILQYIIMILAFLLAFNTVSINTDERVRELATMGAFGTPIRMTIRMLMIEGLIIGLFGTILGYFPLGFLVTLIMKIQVDNAMPEINLQSYLFVDSVTIILSIGILLVMLTPLLTIRKLIKMDLPSALRIIE
ncbi:MAG: ABC transporter permease [Candidatus Hodarchaeales archaeon]|jgi:putative ABC transport system permease protein